MQNYILFCFNQIFVLNKLSDEKAPFCGYEVTDSGMHFFRSKNIEKSSDSG
jgi:hypothetical protein